MTTELNADKEVLAIMCEEWKREAREHFKLEKQAEKESDKREAELVGSAFLACAKELEHHLRLGRNPSYLNWWRNRIAHSQLRIHQPSQSVL